MEAGWARLLTALSQEVEHIDGLGAHLIPSIEFSDLGDDAQAARFRRDLKRYGVGVVRKVVPKADAKVAMGDTMSYAQEQYAKQPENGNGQNQTANRIQMRSEDMDPACYNMFWSPAQVRMRAHENVRKAQKFMMGLWNTNSDGPIAAKYPIAYADRIRVYSTQADSLHHHKQQHPTRGRENGGRKSQATENTQSPEDWITALHSSSGIIAQVDNGSLERWEPDGYQRAGTYGDIFRGRWEDYDPWRSECRSGATTDLYNGHGACSVFRMFQGVLALSVVEPGVIRLLPSPKVAATYYLLRPFFKPRRDLPENWESMSPESQRQEWACYLDAKNWTLQRDENVDSVIHGAVPGHAQRVTERWHPHLHLRSSMITLPTLQPGDYILWHPDLPYHISSGESSFAAAPSTSEPSLSMENTRMLVYIPAVPLTQTSALYLARQRKAFQRGQPGPDFDSSGKIQPIEKQRVEQAEEDMNKVGGKDALRAMGIAPWDVSELVTRESTPSDVAMPVSAPRTKTGRNGEGEVVRLANIILFPETSLAG